MSTSVSKINIVVGASTGQLQAGMNQASQTVKRSMGNIQNVAQSATYAVDDFFAAFSTGGLAGGLRGAGNNLTQLASMIGGIKTQLAVIAGLAIGQLLIKQFSGAKTEAQALNAELDRMSQHAKTMKGLADIRQGTIEQQGLAAKFRNKPAASFEEFRDERERIKAEIKSSEKLRDAAQRESARINAETIKEARMAIAMGGGKIDPEVAKRLKSQMADAERNRLEARMHDNAAADLRRQEKLLDERQKEMAPWWQRQQEGMNAGRERGIQGGPFITPEMRRATQLELEKVTDELNAAKSRVSMADVFRMMPGANAFGSSGAVGAINAAMIGPANARDAGQALQRQSLQELRRIRELEEKKKGLLEAVSL